MSQISIQFYITNLERSSFCHDNIETYFSRGDKKSVDVRSSYMDILMNIFWNSIIESAYPTLVIW